MLMFLPDRPARRHTTNVVYVVFLLPLDPDRIFFCRDPPIARAGPGCKCRRGHSCRATFDIVDLRHDPQILGLRIDPDPNNVASLFLGLLAGRDCVLIMLFEL
jgi:hypothetical protein